MVSAGASRIHQRGGLGSLLATLLMHALLPPVLQAAAYDSAAMPGVAAGGQLNGQHAAWQLSQRRLQVAPLAPALSEQEHVPGITFRPLQPVCIVNCQLLC